MLFITDSATLTKYPQLFSECSTVNKIGYFVHVRLTEYTCEKLVSERSSDYYKRRIKESRFTIFPAGYSGKYFHKFKDSELLNLEEKHILSCAMQIGQWGDIGIISYQTKLLEAAYSYKFTAILPNEFIRNYLYEKKETPIKKRLKSIFDTLEIIITIIIGSLIVSLSIFTLGLIIIGEIGNALKTVIEFFKKITIPLYFQYFILGLIGLLIGTLLFVFRERRKIIYGLLEISFGIATVIWVFYQNHEVKDMSLFFALFGGIYIIVRGWDNIYKSLENTSYEFLFRKLLRIVRKPIYKK